LPAPTDLLIGGGVIGTASAFYAQFAEPEYIALMYGLFRRVTLNRAFDDVRPALAR
jgi:hypothetical protein